MKRPSKPGSDERGFWNSRPVAGRPPGEWVLVFDTAARDLPPGDYPGLFHVEHRPSGIIVWCPDRATADATLREAAKGPGKSRNAGAMGLWTQILVSRGQEVPPATQDAPKPAGPAESQPAGPTRQNGGKRAKAAQETDTETAQGDDSVQNDTSESQRIMRGLMKLLDNNTQKTELTPARGRVSTVQRVLDAIPELDAKLTRVIEDGLTASRTFIAGTGDGAREIIVEDHTTRLKTWELVMAYEVGRPIERQQIIHADHPTKPGDFLLFLNSSKEARDTVRAILDAHREEDGR